MTTAITEKYQLDPEQVKAYEKFAASNGGVLWMLVGEGKTRPALLTAHDVIKESGHTVMLVVARRAAFYDWEQEVATLQLGYKVRELENCPLNGIYTEPTIILVSEGRVYDDITQDMIRQLYLNKQLGFIILDEGWLYKNPRGLKHKAVRRWTELVPALILSGSIMTARDITDIFGQVAAVGRAKALGRTLTEFRSRYMMGIAAAAGQASWGGGWYPKPGGYKAIMEAIEPFTHVYMPDVRRVETKSSIIKVKPTEFQLAYIKELKETAALEGHFELTNMASIITKAQQISDGWIKNADGSINHIQSSKLKRLELLLEELMQTEYKVVVWCAFREDINRIMPIALDLSKKVATMQSGQAFDIEMWKQDDCRICLATEASGSSVNHFAQVPYGIYFSQDCKWHSLQQSSGRHARRSSEHDTAYNIFLHTEKSLDAQVHYVVRASQHSEKSFVKQMDVLQWLKGGKG